MNNQLNYSNPDSTTSVSLKNVFKKRKDASVHFDVFNDECNTSSECILGDKIDVEPETPEKQLFTKKIKNPNQNCFDVTFDNSQIEVENEQSVVSFKGKKLFGLNKKRGDFEGFHVSFNESDRSKNHQCNQKNSSDTGIDTSVSLEKNQFMKKKGNPQEYNFNVDYEETNVCSLDASSSVSLLLFNKGNRKSNVFEVSYDETGSQQACELDDNSVDENENQSYITSKGNPFKKPLPKSANDVFHVEFDDSSLNDNTEASVNIRPIFKKLKKSSLENFQISFNNTCTSNKSSESKLSYSPKVSVTVNENPEKESINDVVMPEKLSETKLNCSPTINTKLDEKLKKESERERNSFNKDLVRKESNLFKDSVTESENLRHESSKILQVVDVSRISGKSNEESIKVSDKPEKFMSANGTSEMYLDQSSYNDDNLKNWMSDHSDDDIHPPSVPDIVANISPVRKQMSKASTIIPSGNSSSLFNWVEKVNQIVLNVKKNNEIELSYLYNKKSIKPDDKATKKTPKEDTYKPQKLSKPARFATKRLYHYIIKKLEPKFGIDSTIKAEELILLICDTVKKVTRRRAHQKKLIQSLKKEMALVGVIETTVDFYEFVIKFLPHNFRVKVVPCIQPITNTVFPPKDNVNPFEKIL